MDLMKRGIYLLPIAFVLAAGMPGATAATPKKAKPAVKPMVKNQTKGQGQMTGANGEFGEVYTLTSGFNFEILSASYSLDPFVAYETLSANTNQKLVVINIAVKNSTAADNWFSTADMFTFVDSKGALYPTGTFSQASNPTGESLTLRPGQGVGQPSLNDPVRVAAVIPGDARIVKIMVNYGRKGRDEKVVRYFVSGATAAEAGEAGDPKNVIAPLSDDARDPADPSGATALAKGKGIMGQYQPSGVFDLRLDDFAYSADAVISGNPPDAGKQYAIATITAKSLVKREQSVFDITGGDFPLFEITDADGERYKPVDYRKAKRDEAAEHTFQQGDEYTMRIVFSLPSDAKAKTLTLGVGGSRVWNFDVSGK